MTYSVYIMASRRNGTLYTGVTNLGRRVWEHREGHGSQFVRRYGVDLLVWAEAYAHVVEAIAAEKRLKRWHRAWKIQLIETSNPDWSDISDQLH